ncbi:MAG: Fic family protein [Gammaproteobacteria bacterium]|nr:Fic family protein [Gammaproteobacteria bacterium]
MYHQLMETLTFPKALVYNFEPEDLPAHQQDRPKIELFFHVNQQYMDMLQGYLYAQNTVCPKLQTSTIDAEQLLEEISQLHARMGNTILACLDVTAGKYTEQYLYRWHRGAALQDEFTAYLSGCHEYKTDKSFGRHLQRDYKVNLEDTQAFISLLRQIKDNDTIIIDPVQINLISVPEQYRVGSVVLTKLSAAYNAIDILTPADKRVIDKIVKICMFPSDIPAAMHSYAVKTLQNFQNCDRTDLDAVTTFLAESFYELVEIHPFTNANGRVATCLMNVFLRSFGYPAIFLRHVGDRENEDSLYSVAFREIDVSRESLRLLIKKRIMDETHTPFSDPKAEKLLGFRMTLFETFKRIQSLSPSYEVYTIVENALSLEEFALQHAGPEDTDVLYMAHLVTTAAEIEKKLKPFDRAQQNLVAEKLAQLSGHEGWNVGVKKHALIQIEGKESAEQIVTLLLTHRLAESVEMKPHPKQSGAFWLTIKNIDAEMLLAVDTIETTLPAAAT